MLGTGSSFRYSLRQFHKAKKDFAAQMDGQKHENISILCRNAFLKGPICAITASLESSQNEAGQDGTYLESQRLGDKGRQISEF